MNDSKAPFEKFKVTHSWSLLWGRFKVTVWPHGSVLPGLAPSGIDVDQRQFIEDAIREKLERRAGQKKRSRDENGDQS